MMIGKGSLMLRIWRFFIRSLLIYQREHTTTDEYNKVVAAAESRFRFQFAHIPKAFLLKSFTTDISLPPPPFHD
jgi:hypothetical protein